MSYSQQLREQVEVKRKRGYSINELANDFGIAKSTISLWVRSVNLDDRALERLRQRKALGQYRSAVTKQKKAIQVMKDFEAKATITLHKVSLNVETQKLVTSFLFWTEGGKHSDSYVYFMNSDAVMVRTFMTLLRSSFKLNEEKFRALIHIHEYHHDSEVKDFWSQVTGISANQFFRSYLKPNTKKRIRDGYQGCISIRYYDGAIARELRSLYTVFARDTLKS